MLTREDYVQIFTITVAINSKQVVTTLKILYRKRVTTLSYAYSCIIHK